MALSSRGGGQAPFCDIGNHCMCRYQSITLKLVILQIQWNPAPRHLSVRQCLPFKKNPLIIFCSNSILALGHFHTKAYNLSYKCAWVKCNCTFLRHLFWCMIYDRAKIQDKENPKSQASSLQFKPVIGHLRCFAPRKSVPIYKHLKKKTSWAQ